MGVTVTVNVLIAFCLGNENSCSVVKHAGSG